MSKPSLEGRTAHCAYGCGSEKPSDYDLPFFEYRGEGSYEALEGCKNCGFFRLAHEANLARKHPWEGICTNFEPRGGQEHDHYYCGCLGWD
jgi:hypothetical protein